SFRKLTNLYSGKPVRLRRSSDGSDADICFDANDRVSGSSPVDTDGDGFCDDGTLNTWKGASTLTLRRWYDQSGQNKHLNAVTGSIDVKTNAGGWYYAETGSGEEIRNPTAG